MKKYIFLFLILTSFTCSCRAPKTQIILLGENSSSPHLAAVKQIVAKCGTDERCVEKNVSEYNNTHQNGDDVIFSHFSYKKEGLTAKWQFHQPSTSQVPALPQTFIAEYNLRIF